MFRNWSHENVKSSARVHRTNTTARQSLGGNQRLCRYAENNENLAHVSDEKRSNEEEKATQKSGYNVITLTQIFNHQYGAQVCCASGLCSCISSCSTEDREIMQICCDQMSFQLGNRSHSCCNASERNRRRGWNRKWRQSITSCDAKLTTAQPKQEKLFVKTLCKATPPTGCLRSEQSQQSERFHYFSISRCSRLISRAAWKCLWYNFYAFWLTFFSTVLWVPNHPHAKHKESSTTFAPSVIGTTFAKAVATSDNSTACLPTSKMFHHKASPNVKRWYTNLLARLFVLSRQR